MKRCLYLGLDPVRFPYSGEVVHYPVIKIVPRALDDPEIQAAFSALPDCTHLLFTSKSSVEIFFDHFAAKKWPHQQLVAIGRVTADFLTQRGHRVDLTAREETQEGLVECLAPSQLKEAYFFLPRSSLSRAVLTKHFDAHHIRYKSCTLYDTHFQHLHPVPDLADFDTIVFTSPSTVKGFLNIYRTLPSDKELLAIGPITADALRHCQST